MKDVKTFSSFKEMRAYLNGNMNEFTPKEVKPKAEPKKETKVEPKTETKASNENPKKKSILKKGKKK